MLNGFCKNVAEPVTEWEKKNEDTHIQTNKQKSRTRKYAVKIIKGIEKCAHTARGMRIDEWDRESKCKRDSPRW